MPAVYLTPEELPYKRTGNRFNDISGQRFGRLVAQRVIGRYARPSNGETVSLIWECICDCGQIASVHKTNLLKKQKATISCGCWNTEKRIKHGHSVRQGERSRTYRAWVAMVGRSTNPRHPSYADYGGRGIKLDPRWRDFRKFLADMGEVPPNQSLNRINNNGNYEPSNCEWADKETQATNKRSNHRLTARGQTKTISQWLTETGIGRSTLIVRLKSGWSTEDAIFQPVKKYKPRFHLLSPPSIPIKATLARGDMILNQVPAISLKVVRYPTYIVLE